MAQNDLDIFGPQGFSNGVVVKAGSREMGDYPAWTSTGKNKVTTVSVNPGITSGAALAAYGGAMGRVSSGGVVGHEANHAYDERVILKGRNPRTAQESYDTERRAYALQGQILRAEGVSQYGDHALWSESWRGRRDEAELMNQAARYAAWNWRAIPGPVPNPW